MTDQDGRKPGMDQHDLRGVARHRPRPPDRSGTVEDPFGQVWTISTHVEDVPPDELRRRMEAFAKS